MHFLSPFPLFLLGKTSLYWHPWCFYQNDNYGLNQRNACRNTGLLEVQTQHRVAVQAFFAASADDLNATYRPGRTEANK